ncbi:hypothetical protein [Halotia branconii]|uniref:Spore coat protein U domain-containing protein n=1 Tax=Halotia branconii CENA392 TaxID=1539056 RepID=A0AAJ6NRZ4_9CYAN|nr:hypothetical protein [Halotia branconii]WGV25419.1 hypothetical protein QI031_27380 [Halotia branconii CENA392]
MFYRLALTSSLMLASAIALDQAALAQSADVPFNGTVPIQTTFSNSSGGTAQSTGIVGVNGNANRYESITPATVSVQSTTPATITVSPPRLVSGETEDPSGTKHTAFVKFGSTNFRSDVGGGSAPLPAGNTNLEISMLIERPQAFTPGTYIYVVTLTITP